MREEACTIWWWSVPYWLSCMSAWSYSTLALAFGSSLIAKASVGNFCWVFFLYTWLCVLLDKQASSCLLFSNRVNNCSSSAFELVHSDVWGPSCVPSSKGFRYFLIFVNDFSRMTWLYLQKERSKVSSVIELFQWNKNSIFYLYPCALYWQCPRIYEKWCLFFVLRMKLFIKHLAPIRPNRMVLRNTNTS